MDSLTDLCLGNAEQISIFGELRILFHQGSYKDKFRRVVSWFCLRQDASETHFKKVGSPIYFLKKIVRESLKNTRALMVERNNGSNYKVFFSFSRWAE